MTGIVTVKYAGFPLPERVSQEYAVYEMNQKPELLAIKAPKNRLKKLSQPKEIKRFKNIIRLMLDRLEALLQQDLPKTAEEISDRHKQHECMLGAKTSVIAAMMMLMELMLKIQQTEDMAGPEKNSPNGGASDMPFSQSDIALVEEFIRREKTS